MADQDTEPILTDHDNNKSRCSKFCQDYGETVKRGVTRQKSLSRDMEKLLKTTLKRCLGTMDLLAYGLASMLGGSIYVLTGAIMNTHTGPAVFVAYLLAGVVALFNVLVYSELACRIPMAGSCYSYSYVILGELLAFLTGWSVLLEYILSISTVARGWSDMLDGLVGGRIKEWIITNVGRLAPPRSFLAEYPDLIGVTLIIFTASVSCCGIRSSARLTGVFMFIYFCTLLVVSIFMLVYNKPGNLSLPVPANVTMTDPLSVNREFLPFGLGGLIGGVAICFNAFIGFDAISTCAEETESPGKSIPRASVLAVFCVTVVTVMASLALTLYQPWYLITQEAPFLNAIQGNIHGGPKLARDIIFYVVGVGCLIGLSSSLLSYLIAGPRICYSIAEDGLLPACCANVCQPFQTPVISTTFITITTALLDLLFSIESLADFLSLGTLVAYSIASVSLLALRYCPQPEFRDSSSSDLQATVNDLSLAEAYKDDRDPIAALQHFDRTDKPGYIKKSWSTLVPEDCVKTLNRGSPGSILKITIPLYLLFNTALILVLRLGSPQSSWPLWRVITVPVLLVLMLGCVICTSAYEQYSSTHRQLFRLPLVPLFPFATISVNMFLMAQLSWVTWTRFGIWLFVGFMIYFTYGVCHSQEAKEEGGDILAYGRKPKADDAATLSK